MSEPNCSAASSGDDVLAGLPDDLARVLRDPSIIVPQDAAVFELIAKWADAPSDTVSAWGVDEWRAAWVKEAQRANRFKAELEELREANRLRDSQMKASDG